MPSILAVDDSASMRKMVVFTLAGAGYQVTEAVDGQDAFEKAQSQTFDLVLTDQILTTESSDEMKQQGRAAGATGWLVKPFDPNRLIEVIRRVIK
jgi:two-component system, chemotaxis family, chemotaxis protein CheY